MTEPVWLPVELVLAIHERQLRQFGGPSGVRDIGALESALGRARNRWAYEDGDLASLAAAFAFGLTRNHPFVDGNKRTALVSLVTFLGLNGVDFLAAEAEAVIIIRDLAAGDVDETGLARWIRDNWPRA
jgi:death-on-curing protein